MKNPLLLFAAALGAGLLYAQSQKNPYSVSDGKLIRTLFEVEGDYKNSNGVHTIIPKDINTADKLIEATRPLFPSGARLVVTDDALGVFTETPFTKKDAVISFGDGGILVVRSVDDMRQGPQLS